MKKLIIFAFAIIALCSCSGNGCSRFNPVKQDSLTTDTLVKDSVDSLDTIQTDSTVCLD